MPIATPVTITVNGVAHAMPRINQDNYASQYRKIATGYQYDFAVRHSTESAKAGSPRVDRHNVDLKLTTFDAEGVPTVYQSYLVLRTPQGADPVIVRDMAVGFEAYLTSAILTQIIGWES